MAEWARLVAEITPDYCTPYDAPVPGREDQYSLAMEYRVVLAQSHDRDLARAAALQEKLVVWNRQQAAAALVLPPAAPLDAGQRHRIRTLGVSVFALGQILREQGNLGCVAAYEETIQYCQRTQDSIAESTTHFNLGSAYMELPAIRNLDAAEAAYQRSLDGWAENDLLSRSKSIKQIGTVHHERFNEARQRDEPEPTVLKHAQAAEAHYQRAIVLCPATALTDLWPVHTVLGALYAEVGETDKACDSYEKAVLYAEQAGNRHGAGQIRYNMALMYLQAAAREESPARQRDLLLRAQAYAQAALRDFQHYEGRAAAEEAKAQGLIDRIGQALA